MESLDAQCLVIDLVTTEDGPMPDQWQHRSDGVLMYRFGDGGRTFSWPAAPVAEMAARWRESGRRVPAPIAQIVESHRAFVALLDDGGLEQPETITHHLKTGELIALWSQDRPAVVIGPE